MKRHVVKHANHHIIRIREVMQRLEGFLNRVLQWPRRRANTWLSHFLEYNLLELSGHWAHRDNQLPREIGKET